jgi:hypothetical protein
MRKRRDDRELPKTIRVIFRVDEKQYGEIIDATGHLSISEFCRTTILNRRTTRPSAVGVDVSSTSQKDPPLPRIVRVQEYRQLTAYLEKTLRQLTGAANNLNQLTKEVHTVRFGGPMPSTEQVERAIAAVECIARDLADNLP